MNEWQQPGDFAQQIPQYYTPPAVEQRERSALAVASFVMALVGGVLALAGAITATAMTFQARNSGTGLSNTAPAMVASGLGIIGGVLVCLLGLVLGVASLVTTRDRVFGWLGTSINGFVVFVMFGLWVIGMLVK